jgi:hypothetical protein
MAPGVLYSALKKTQPERLLVIGSPGSLNRVEEILERAAFQGESMTHTIEDPFTSFQRVNKETARALEKKNMALRSIQERLRNAILDAEEVRVCLTGGTTLLGFFAQRMHELAGNLGRPSRRFALIDTRSPEEQREKPWVVGEMIWLDEGVDE